MPFWFLNTLALLSHSNKQSSREELDKLLERERKEREKRKAFNRSAEGFSHRLTHGAVYSAWAALLCEWLGKQPPNEVWEAMAIDTLPSATWALIVTMFRTLLYRLYAIFDFDCFKAFLFLFVVGYGSIEIIRQVYYAFEKRKRKEVQ